MKTLYLDCGMGAAGDMLAAALLELLPDPDAFVRELNGLNLPGVAIAREPAVKCGITGTHFSVKVNGVEEESH
ncbi:MAG: LarC family nickel insertion protein, partial [Oscillibacter sp.]|nr:LarC family nickel insertion protein [Oscillibacter sp.]